MTVVGVDACPGGWIAVVLADGQAPTGLFVERLDRLVDHVGHVHGVGVDIPIGLPGDGRRRADVEARAFVGPRRASVFFTPVRGALVAPTHAEASAISRQRTGHGVSRQAYGLASRILEADGWAAGAPFPVWEVHPEVSFTVLLGHPPRASKSTWSGLRERERALGEAGIDLGAIGPAGDHATPDDVVDAAAVAWSTARLVRGDGTCLPDPPEVEPGTGRPMAIWY